MDNKAPGNVAIVQPLPGIGDMIWHLPHIRAIAAHEGGPVTLLAKPRSLADQIFAAEATVRQVLWVDRNPEQRRGNHDGGSGWLRLVGSIRARRFSRVYVLHHSRTLAFLTLAAGIPLRQGYGYGSQRLFLNHGPFLPGSVFPLHPFKQASTWLAAAGIRMQESEPVLPVAAAAREAVRQRLGVADEPMVAVGVGSSEAYKQWGAAQFTTLIGMLRAAGWRRFVLIGGPADAPLIEAVRAALAVGPTVAAGKTAVPGRPAQRAADTIDAAIGWPIAEVAAACAMAAFYVGNDTGVMNIAAAVGARTYGLFGAVAPFRHSGRVVPVTPPGGVDLARGMAAITPAAVLDIIRRDQAIAWAAPDRIARV